MKFIDLFAGIGGFRYGLEACNADKKRREKRVRRKLRHKSTINTVSKERLFSCVWSNEWDKYAAQIYRKHWGECDTRDITTVKADEIPDHDLICGGFPCQSFSVAGKRLGFEDTRGTLFYDIARIAKHKRPRHLLLENVKGLLSHEEGETFQTMLGVLADIGYRTEWMVLNSKDFGVPQNRERVFIIGHLRKECSGQVFPVKSKGDYAYTVDASNTSGVREGMKIRRLTPTECERLQGFPDGWTEGISDTQRYKCLGNAVTTNVITEIGKGLLKHDHPTQTD